MSFHTQAIVLELPIMQSVGAVQVVAREGAAVSEQSYLMA